MKHEPPAPGNQPLSVLQAMLSGEGPTQAPPAPEVLEALMRDLEKASLLDHAVALLGPLRGDPAWAAFRFRLKAESARYRDRRISRWQADPERRTLRLAFEASGPACGLNPQALAGALARAFLDAGLPLAMGLEKSPRPVLHLAHPLPLGVPGREEWADAGLFRDPECAPAEIPALVNVRACEGLRVLRCAYIPNFATPVSELCQSAAWRWPCPGDLRARAEARCEAFLAAESFELEKPGKTGGHKGVKRVEIRPMVEALEWEGPFLAIRTRVDAGTALNPRKLLGAVLGLEAAEVEGLERTGLGLAEDPRLAQAERFEPKLHNMYEDAVLLEGGPGITIVEGDEDDTIVLGG